MAVVAVVKFEAWIYKQQKRQLTHNGEYSDENSALGHEYVRYLP